MLSPSQVESLADEVDARVRETAAAAQARALTVASAPRLAWAVATDENTMLDLTADELAFQPLPGESIEIGQVQRRTGQTTTLRRVGTTLFPLPLGQPGLHLLASGDELHAAAIVTLEPKVRIDVLRGAVAVSRRVDFGPLVTRLAQAGAAARVETAQGSVTIGSAPVEARALPRALRGDPDGAARMVLLLPTRQGPTLGFVLAALAVLLLSFGGAVLLWMHAAPLPVPTPRPVALVAPVPPLGRGVVDCGHRTPSRPTPLPPRQPRV